VDLVVDIEGLRGGAALGTRPEWVAGGVKVIRREKVKQVLDGVVVVPVEDTASFKDNFLQIGGLLDANQRVNVTELCADT